MCHNCATEDHRIFCRLRSTPRLRAFGRVAAAVRDASLRETVGIGSRILIGLWRHEGRAICAGSARRIAYPFNG